MNYKTLYLHFNNQFIYIVILHMIYFSSSSILCNLHWITPINSFFDIICITTNTFRIGIWRVSLNSSWIFQSFLQHLGLLDGLCLYWNLGLLPPLAKTQANYVYQTSYTLCIAGLINIYY